MRKRIYSLLIFLTGSLIGGTSLFLIGWWPIRFDNSLYHYLGARKPQIVGFMPYWLLDKADSNYKDVTTLTYFGLTLDTDGKTMQLINEHEEDPGWTELRGDLFKSKRNAFPGQKLSLLIHQSDEASLSALLVHPMEKAQNLISDISPIMRKHVFNDLNLDLESFSEASGDSRLNMTTFIKEVKQGLARERLGTLTVEVTPISLVKKHLLDPVDIGQIVDYIVLMAYDYHYSGSFISGPVAPVAGAPEVREYDVETAIKEALKMIPPEKLILGIPLYGYEWESLSKNSGQPVIPGTGATASNRRIEKLLADCPNCEKGFDSVSKSPYVIFPDGDSYHQVFYENAQSFTEKLTLAKKYELGGVALWALGYEGEGMLKPLDDYKHHIVWK